MFRSVISTEDEKPSAPCTYAVGEMIKVWYGKGKFLKQYIAKVSGNLAASTSMHLTLHFVLRLKHIQIVVILDHGLESVQFHLFQLLVIAHYSTHEI